MIKRLLGLIILGLFTLSLLLSREVNALETVAIDPGHGGEEPGCIGLQETREKDVTLQIAIRLGQMLEDRLGLKTVLTRRGDYAVDLVERTGIANHNKADLFISLHANSAFSSSQTGQMMVFINSSSAEDDVDIGYDNDNNISFEEREEVEAILWDMVQTELQNDSYQFAVLITEEAKKKGFWRQALIKRAPLLVLKGAQMPAVEIEIDFLSSRQGEDSLLDEWYQEMFCEVIYRAINRFGHKLEEYPNETTW